MCQECRRLFADGETKPATDVLAEAAVCDARSTNIKPVPGRGWGQEPVRVFDRCFV